MSGIHRSDYEVKKISKCQLWEEEWFIISGI